MTDSEYLNLPQVELEKIIKKAIENSKKLYKEDNFQRRIERDRSIGSNIMKRISKEA